MSTVRVSYDAGRTDGDYLLCMMVYITQHDVIMYSCIRRQDILIGNKRLQVIFVMQFIIMLSYGHHLLSL